MGGVMATLRRRGATDTPGGELEQPLLSGRVGIADDGAAITPLAGLECRWPLHLGALVRALAAAWRSLLGAPLAVSVLPLPVYAQPCCSDY